MANNKTQGVYTYDVDEVDMMQLLKSVRGIEADLRKDINNRIKAASASASEQLVRDLAVAAVSGSAPPQAAFVANSIRVKKDRLAAVRIGGKRGGRTRSGATAGHLLFGSERGTTGAPDRDGSVRNRFVKPHNAGGYWIRPTINAFIDTKAWKDYHRAVVQILNAEGLL